MHHVTKMTTVGELRMSDPAKVKELGLEGLPDGQSVAIAVSAIETTVATPDAKPLELKPGQKLVDLSGKKPKSPTLEPAIEPLPAEPAPKRPL